jgi:iron complex outermembrane receptor protein
MNLKNVFLGAMATWPLAATTVLAQGAPANGEQPEADAIGEVIVTAQRREENLRDVPLAITVATREALEARNFSNPAQLPLLVPSLQLTNFQASPGATNFSVRGIGTASFSHLIEPSVATVIDGVVMGRPEMGVMEFSDLERVEVLNGPQGMLFGKNASAGLVNIVTARPRIGQTSFDGEVTGGSIDAARHTGTWRVNGTANLPVGVESAARLTGYYADDGSLIGNPNPSGFSDFGRRQYGGRAKLLFNVSDALSLYLSGDYSHSSGMGTGAYTARTSTPAGSLAALDAVYGITPSPNNLFQTSDAPTTLQYDVGGLQGELTYDLGNGLVLTNITAWRTYDSDHSIDFDLRQRDIVNVSAAAFKFNQFTNELRLTSASGQSLEYQFGLFYYDGTSKRTDNLAGLLDLGPPPPGFNTWLGIHAQNDLDTKSYAAYGQGTWHATEKLSLTAGGRLTRDELDFNGRHDYDGIVIGIAGDGGPNSYAASQGHTDLSARLSARYEFDTTVSGYATVAKGYKGPGYNLSWSGNPGGLPVGDETTIDYEIGVKALVAHRLRLDLAAYWEDFSDFQVQSFRTTGIAGVGSFVIQNAGKLRARGLEGNFSLQLSNALAFSGGAAFNDANYTTFRGATCYPGQTVVQGCVGGVTDASGNRLVNAPRFSGNLALDYDGLTSAGWRIVGHADVYARGKVNFSANGDPGTTQSSYALANASIGFGNADKSWTASVFCRNCTNKHFVTFVENNPGGGPGDYGQSFALDSFRTIGAKLAVRF